jgi:hypothetical protein
MSSTRAAPSKTKVSHLKEIFSGQAPSPKTVSSFTNDSFLSDKASDPKTECSVFVCRMTGSCSCAENDAIRSCPHIQIAPGMWIYDPNIKEINQLHKYCIESGFILPHESVLAEIEGIRIMLAPFDSKAHPCEIEGCGCEEELDMACEDDERESSNDADNEQTD